MLVSKLRFVMVVYLKESSQRDFDFSSHLRTAATADSRQPLSEIKLPSVNRRDGMFSLLFTIHRFICAEIKVYYLSAVLGVFQNAKSFGNQWLTYTQACIQCF